MDAPQAALGPGSGQPRGLWGGQQQDQGSGGEIPFGHDTGTFWGRDNRKWRRFEDSKKHL